MLIAGDNLIVVRGSDRGGSSYLDVQVEANLPPDFVTNTLDAGSGSLREAIVRANSHPGPDLIRFNIPGTGVQTIALSSRLPQVTDQVLIDGYTQPGASPNALAVGDNAALVIELNGGHIVRDERASGYTQDFAAIDDAVARLVEPVAREEQPVGAPGLDHVGRGQSGRAAVEPLELQGRQIE